MPESSEIKRRLLVAEARKTAAQARGEMLDREGRMIDHWVGAYEKLLDLVKEDTAAFAYIDPSLRATLDTLTQPIEGTQAVQTAGLSFEQAAVAIKSGTQEPQAPEEQVLRWQEIVSKTDDMVRQLSDGKNPMPINTKVQAVAAYADALRAIRSELGLRVSPRKE